MQWFLTFEVTAKVHLLRNLISAHTFGNNNENHVNLFRNFPCKLFTGTVVKEAREAVEQSSSTLRHTVALHKLAHTHTNRLSHIKLYGHDSPITT